MIGNIPRATAVVFLVSAGWAQEQDIATVRLLTERLHAAYAAKDSEAIAALWSDRSPDKVSYHEATARLLHNSSGRPIKEVTVGDPELTGDRARLRVDRDAPPAPRAQLIVEWVREAYGYKIWKEIPAAEDLAARVAALPSGEDPARLLAVNQDLDASDLATALNGQATTVRNRGDSTKALALLELARTAAERAESASARALVLNSLGLVYADRGEYQQAAESYRASLDLSRRAADDPGSARALNNLSAVYSDIGDLTTAAEYQGKSLAIAEKLRDRNAITKALGNMAIVHARRGDYLGALSLLEQCHEQLKGGSDKRSLAANFNNIGNVYLWQGDLEQAEENFKRELEIAAAAELKPLAAVAWIGLGRVAEFRGDWRAAIGNYEKSLAALNETGDKPFAASDLTFIGSAYSWLGDQDKAAEYLEKGLEIQRAMRANSEAALTMGRIAEVYNRKADFAKALQTAREGREMGSASGVREAVWRADLEAGRAEQGLGEKAIAEQRFRDAIANIEALRQGVGGAETEQEAFFETKLEPYHRLAGLLIASGRAAEALELAERAKARVLTDVLRNGRTEMVGLMSPEERVRDQDLRFRLAGLNRQLMRASSRSSQADVSAVNTKLASARAEYESFQNQLYIAHPRWKATETAAQSMTAEQAQSLLANSKSAFLEFTVTEDQVYAFAALPSGKLKAYAASISREALEKQVALLQRQMAERNLGFRTTSAVLYEKLMAPAHLDLAGVRHLVIIPDGVLWELPFQALTNAQGRYLLDECAISIAPSLTALKAMMDVKEQRRSTPAGTQLLAMGDPVVDSRFVGRVKALYRGATLGPLPAAL